MLADTLSFRVIMVLILSLIHQVSNEMFVNGHGRWLQIAPSSSMAYSSYSSLQIYNLLNWKNNDKLINNINQQNGLTFKVAHNQFSYLSLNQIAQIYLNIKVSSINEVNVQASQNSAFGANVYASSTALKPINSLSVSKQPISSTNKQNIIDVDWRNILTTSVKDQGVCGACWAFAAAADIQVYLFQKYKLLFDVSEQQLIDCSSSYGNVGCTGGMMDNAYQYVIKEGITLQSVYPFKQIAKKCMFSKSIMPGFTITGSQIIYNDCSALADILQKRPVSVVISANPSFIFYKQGVLNDCGSTINHALQLVGLYKNATSGYYIGKNSWGTNWGQSGFVFIDSLVKNGNLCNVCSYPQYPL